jgi:hypothetical protein
MKEKEVCMMKAVCCMTVRDCAQYLWSIFSNLERLRKLFQEFTLLVAYDHCVDGSEIFLTYFKSVSSFKVVLLPSDTDSPLRTVRIADARNRCLDYMDTLDNDVHFMVDADDVNIKPWNITLLKYYLEKGEWDCVSFNRPDYYDIWALMYPPFKHHCWGFRNHSRQVVQYMKEDVMKRLEECNEWIPCESAFNGFAMYITKRFKGIRYDGTYRAIQPMITNVERQNTLVALSPLNLPLELDEQFPQSCEHLYYHLSAIQKKGVRIFISKYMLTS